MPDETRVENSYNLIFQYIQIQTHHSQFPRKVFMPQGCDQFTDGFSSALLCIKGPLVSITIPFHPLTLSWPDQRSDDPKHGAAPKGTSARSGCFARPNPSSRDCEAARIPKNRLATVCEVVFMIVARKPQAMPGSGRSEVHLSVVHTGCTLSPLQRGAAGQS